MRDDFYGLRQYRYGISQVLSFTTVVIGADVSRDGNQKIGNHADCKDGVFTVADKNNQTNHDRDCA
jgi:hypothetical protein